MLKQFIQMLDLRRIIILISIINITVVLVVVLYITRSNEHQIAQQSAMSHGYIYAQKLGAAIESFFETNQQKFRYSTRILSKHFEDSEKITDEAHRLFYQTESFSSLLILDADGIVRSAYPVEIAEKIINKKISTHGAQEALQEKRSIITKPYIGSSGNLVVDLSEPIFSPQGVYLGLISGSIYIEHNNRLTKTLHEHFYESSAQVFAIDKDGLIISSTEKSSIGKKTADLELLSLIQQRRSGSFESKNSSGVRFINSFYYIENINWGVLIKTPFSLVTYELDKLFFSAIAKISIFIVIGIFVIHYSSKIISSPLSKLAKYTQLMDQNSAHQLKNINAWYFEAHQLKQAIIKSLQSANQQIISLNQDVVTDHLTSLFNRRGTEQALEQLRVTNKSFSVIAIDIDHFKRVNDTYGHDTGDHVLKFLADQMRLLSRDTDLLCRQGGEEFLMLLPKTSLEGAKLLAERLREHIANTESVQGIRITISAGIAEYKPQSSETLESLLIHADQALYQAKTQGRNRTCVYLPH